MGDRTLEQALRKPELPVKRSKLDGALQMGLRLAQVEQAVDLGPDESTERFSARIRQRLRE